MSALRMHIYKLDLKLFCLLCSDKEQQHHHYLLEWPANLHGKQP